MGGDLAGGWGMGGFSEGEDRIAPRLSSSKSEATQPTNSWWNLRIVVCLRQYGWVRDNAWWMNGFPFSLEAPGWFAVACGLALIAAVLAWVRRPAVHRWTLAA